MAYKFAFFRQLFCWYDNQLVSPQSILHCFSVAHFYPIFRLLYSQLLKLCFKCLFYVCYIICLLFGYYVLTCHQNVKFSVTIRFQLFCFDTECYAFSSLDWIVFYILMISLYIKQNYLIRVLLRRTQEIPLVRIFT